MTLKGPKSFKQRVMSNLMFFENWSKFKSMHPYNYVVCVNRFFGLQNRVNCENLPRASHGAVR